MRVSDVTPKPLGTEMPAGLDKRVLVDKGTPFARHLTDMSGQRLREHMEGMASTINAQGEVLKKRADMKELQRYRQLIQEFMNETVSNAYKYDKSSSFDARGRHRVFAVVKKINVTLDALAEEVLKEEEDNIAILSMVDDIRGLIVDLYM